MGWYLLLLLLQVSLNHRLHKYRCRSINRSKPIHLEFEAELLECLWRTELNIKFVQIESFRDLTMIVTNISNYWAGLKTFFIRLFNVFERIRATELQAACRTFVWFRALLTSIKFGGGTASQRRMTQGESSRNSKIKSKTINIIGDKNFDNDRRVWRAICEKNKFINLFRVNHFLYSFSIFYYSFMLKSNIIIL